MSKIAILTDSSCDIPQELAEKYGIDIMGFHILLDDEDIVEREKYTPEEFYNKMRAAKGIPSTAAITPIQFCEKYCQYVDEGYTDVIHVPINRSPPTPTRWCSAGICARWPASCRMARSSATSSASLRAR